MKLSTGYLLALASLSDAEKEGNKENGNMVIVSEKEGNIWGEHCLYEQNEDGILTITTTKGLNEVASCHRQLGCRDGYTLARKIASIVGLQDCFGCEDDDNTNHPEYYSYHCSSNYDHNALKLKYRIRSTTRSIILDRL